MTQFGFTEKDLANWQDKSFLLPGSKDTAVIIFHGWSAIPRQVRSLAKFINKQGYLVYAPLFTGHGTHPDDLAETKTEDWIKDAEEAIKKIRKEKGVKKVILAGISLGGNISFLVSQKIKVEGIVSLGTPIHFKNHFGIWIGSILMPFFKKHLKKNYPKNIQRDLNSLSSTSYQYYPTKSVREVLRSTRRCAFSLRKVIAPVLILQTSKDYIVAKYSPWIIYNSISSKMKKLQWIKLQNEDHVFIQDEMKDCYDLILNFIKEINLQAKKEKK